MKIILNEHGDFSIEENGIIKEKFCPFKNKPENIHLHNIYLYCNDSCALFGIEKETKFIQAKEVEYISVYLCQNRTLTIPKTDFIDLRR